MKRVGLKCLKWLYDIIKKYVGDNYQPKGEYATSASFSSISNQLSTMQNTLNDVKTKLDGYPVMVAADGKTYAFKDGKFELIADVGQSVLTDPETSAATLELKEPLEIATDLVMGEPPEGSIEEKEE